MAHGISPRRIVFYLLSLCVEDLGVCCTSPLYLTCRFTGGYHVHGISRPGAMGAIISPKGLHLGQEPLGHHYV